MSNRVSRKVFLRCVCALAFGCAAQDGNAADFSDTAIAYRYGTHFREPYIDDDIAKNIVALSYASIAAWGQNYFSAEAFFSDDKDPGPTRESGAREVYVLYRNTIDLGNLIGRHLDAGVLRGVGLTTGFDANTKNSYAYSPSKRMLVIGPTVSFDVPGFLNVGVQARRDSYTSILHADRRYEYRWHPAIASAWLIALPDPRFQFEGFCDYIAAKGKDEFGTATKPELYFDGQLMFDVGGFVGGRRGSVRLGAEYQFWRNKYGYDHTGRPGSGAFARTPMVKVDYHF